MNMSHLLLCLLMLPGIIQACTVPVFRYALERWPEDPHHARMPAELAALIQGDSHVNICVEDQSDSADTVITFPDGSTPWFQGPLTSRDLPFLADSPVRRKIAGELAGGTSCVFLYLPGTRDAPGFADTLRAWVDEAAKETLLPTEDPLYDDSQPSSGLDIPVPLLIRFSLHSVAADDIRERFTVAQLQALVDDGYRRELPLVVAVYGRGRALSLPQESLSQDVLADVASFLCDACSCQVKGLNPGVDLLLTMPWDDVLYRYPEPTERIGLNGVRDRMTPGPDAAEPTAAGEPENLPLVSEPDPALESSGHWGVGNVRVWMWLSAAGGVVLSVLIGVIALLRRK